MQVEQLTPSQQHAYQTLVETLSLSPVATLLGGSGFGKTTILRTLHAQLGGAFLTIQDYVEVLQTRHPLAMEEAFERLLKTALQQHDLVILDDLHLLTRVADGYGAYPRSGYMTAPATALATYLVANGKQLVVGAHHEVPSPFKHLSFFACVYQFTSEDYAFLCRHYLGAEIAERLDYEKIHRYAAHLDIYDLWKACLSLKEESDLDTQGFITYLETHGLSSNVDLKEVQTVQLSDLRGCDEIIRALEANIVLPFERDDLAVEFGLRPKRGVLLAGPPGTGKTTVGRALAHRLRSKFFLVDGTVISGSEGFYNRVHGIFQEAQENAPSVLFIDDSDVIFESGEEHGLYRYLLTMLDGLESASAGRVCVILTAMDVGNIPPALLRSGRIELWLETRLPDANARQDILTHHLGTLPDTFPAPDLEPIIDATEGFTGADLKRLVEDAKNLYAYDRVNRVPTGESTPYFVRALETIRENRARYEEAAARAQPQRGKHLYGYGPFPGLNPHPGLNA